MATVLRPYQQLAVDEIRAHARRGGMGAILQMPTGSGKTACFANILGGAYAKGKTGIMVVRGKSLVHQASDRLTREGIEHGVYQGGNTTRINERILVCSVDTLYSRRAAPQADIVVVDECHTSHSESYAWVLANYAASFKLGVSATPHHKRGMLHIGDRLVRPVDITELIRDGYLVGARYFAPYVPNLKGVKKSGDDFTTSDLSERQIKDEILTAKASTVWTQHLRGKITLVYAVSVAHAEILLTSLTDAGARARILTAVTSDADRATALQQLTARELDIIVSVGVLTTGVDIPPLEAIVCCRPTQSYNLWIQIIGRGTRPYPGKTHFLVYDLSGNFLQHGPIEAEAVASLDSVPTIPPLALLHCERCFAIFAPPATECPECGTLQIRERSTSRQRVYGLEDVAEVKEVVVEQWEIDLPKLIVRARERGWKKGAIYHMIREKHGNDIAERAWPRIRSLPRWPVRASTPA